MDYIKRIVDEEIDIKAQAFGAINIVGPKGCGKTRTAKERCNTTIEFQDEELRDGYLNIASTAPSLFLSNEKPILFDEWQDAPKIWGTIRKACDDNSEETGQYFLTGSTSKKVKTPHTGTGRISEVIMAPMTLWETGDSNGKISFSKLFEDENYNIDGFKSDIKLEDFFFIVCRGGWPKTLSLKNKQAQLEIAKDYFYQIYTKDINAIDGVKRNPEIARTLLCSYARNMATLAKKTGIYQDVRATYNVTDVTLASYIEILKQLFVIKDIDAWTPKIRSKTAIRSAKKHIFIDPSIGLAALGVSPEYFYNDLDLFDHVFENMVIRDLMVFANSHNARVLHYNDSYNMEADAVYQMNDGRYALIEIKTGANQIPSAEENLIKFKEVIKQHNQEVMKNKEHPGVPYREPSFLIIICATVPMSFTTERGVKVIPMGCLKD